jgi:hypothetical protein
MIIELSALSGAVLLGSVIGSAYTNHKRSNEVQELSLTCSNLRHQNLSLSRDLSNATQAIDRLVSAVRYCDDISAELKDFLLYNRRTAIVDRTRTANRSTNNSTRSQPDIDDTPDITGLYVAAGLLDDAPNNNSSRSDYSSSSSSYDSSSSSDYSSSDSSCD